MSISDNHQTKEMELSSVLKANTIAWTTGVVVSVLQIIPAVFSNPLYFIDALIFLFLSVGIYYKNRVLSVIMFIYCLFSLLVKVIQQQSYPNLWTGTGVFLFVVISIIMFMGMRSCFNYHKIEQRNLRTANTGSTNEDELKS